MGQECVNWAGWWNECCGNCKWHDQSVLCDHDLATARIAKEHEDAVKSKKEVYVPPEGPTRSGRTVKQPERYGSEHVA